MFALPNLKPRWRKTMTEHSEREDLNHNPEDASKVGETHKKLNEQGEAQRPENKNEPGNATVPTQ